jgi:hypothetical protein
MENDEITSITYFMDLVVSCGSSVGSDEYFIATKESERRDMFLNTVQVHAHHDCLWRNYNAK